jgi:16S rRNA processing protein RimM
VAARICVAQFGAAHGVRGEIRLRAFTENPLAVMRYGPLESRDGGRTFEIEDLREGKGHLIARVKGIGDRDAAEKLVNLELYVPRERLPAIEQKNTFYRSDLVGLDAVGEDGAQIGTVHAVHNFGAGDVLEITPLGSGETLMLSFTETTVPKIDLAAKQIVIVPPAEVEVRENDP